jgi:hypothetical protein
MGMVRRRQIVQGRKIIDSEDEIRLSTFFIFLLSLVLVYEMIV